MFAQLPVGTAHTLGGLVQHQLQKIPQEGDVAEIGGVRFLVERANARAVETVLVSKI